MYNIARFELKDFVIKCGRNLVMLVKWQRHFKSLFNGTIMTKKRQKYSWHESDNLVTSMTLLSCSSSSSNLSVLPTRRMESISSAPWPHVSPLCANRCGGSQALLCRPLLLWAGEGDWTETNGRLGGWRCGTSGHVCSKMSGSHHQIRVFWNNKGKWWL